MACDFPGTNSNYLSVGDVSDIDITGTALTLAAWVQLDNVTGSAGQNLGIIAKWNNGGTTVCQYALVFVHDGTNFKASGIVGDAAGIDQATGATAFPLDTWKHLAVVKNGTGAGGLRVFLDGVEDVSITSAKTIQNTDRSLFMGNLESNTRPIDALIAEAGLWDASLSDAEVVSLARGFSPALVRPQSLKAHWPLLGNNSPETELRNGNNLTMTGTVAKASHPRIIVPHPAIYIP